MLANNKTGRIVRPQINFYTGKKIPVYASSSVFNGIQNKTENLDLENTHFPIMPWVLQSAEVASYAGQLNMLFAMGADAYQVAANFHNLRGNSNYAITGKMGQLHIDDSGEIMYQPVWATFKQGVATANVDITPITTPNQSKFGVDRRLNRGASYNDSNWNPRQSGRKNSP